MPSILHSHYLAERFQALDQFLTEHQPLWKPRPFTALRLDWETTHPELAAHLRQCTLADAEADLDTQSLPAPFPQLAAQARQLSAVGELPDTGLLQAGHRLDVNVPGRKWQQIEAFSRRLGFRQQTRHWLDWCSGKGHLGRRLLQPGQRLTCLEYDPALVEAGQALSDHHQLPATHVRQDVMDPSSAEHLGSDKSVVALHACGELHVQLLRLASQRGCRHVAVAPCCYNRIPGEHYQPLSTAAQRSSLALSLTDLGLPLNEAVTASARVRHQRDCSMARRLGFDLLQREQRQRDEYLSTPSLPIAWLDKPFEQYCRELAELRQVELRGQPDWAALEAAGWQRLAEVRNLERVRNLFRRPLELWLVLDHALFLEEQGYRVSLGLFCDYPLTPRNLLLLAERDT
ncbi:MULTISPECIES: SAM-dependent methyltransferase [unclassified Pseudomonas]|uniref:SAM-dependent methyltransferase n=1 Tax=unclassified Pseudomonas TaxID=196821 RepID=UPI0021BA8548|nr:MULTISPECIES: SAM-dependent methyltransferase [unclassified Pseudomonas]MCT8163280.1 SAM-dependent methyltransferase [Pseudomonas sp. HD6422]MCT8182204.1 SAM-dependent methyltransferase [Pseudomonas sp. HD6421]